ncbi:hypothetical protein D4S03_04345 [bacterium]|nr:MAG: hypothetical protein D4S03_04345 [bacterium]
MLAYQLMISQAKQYTKDQQGLLNQGWKGGARLGITGLEASGETWAAKATQDFITGLPQTLASPMASAFINGLMGKKTDFEQLAIDWAQKAVTTYLQGYLTEILPKAIEGLFQLLGIELPAKQTAAQTAAQTLITGGVGAGQAMIDSAITAASILKGGSAMGGGGWGTGAWPSLDTQVSGSSIAEWMNFTGYHSGGIVKAHGGLAPDEIPAILQTGERVLSRSQNREYESGKTEVKFAPNITVINNSTSAKPSIEQNSSGDLLVIIEDLTTKAYNKRGKLFNAINTGNQPVRR